MKQLIKRFIFVLLILVLFCLNLRANELKFRKLAPRSNECQQCHIKRNQKDVFISSKNITAREHSNILLSHGNAKNYCNDCHDIEHSNKLFSPATFENTSAVCARCHFERFNEWQQGSHGKKVGNWKKSVSFHCIDCHNPHSVSIEGMQSRLPPKIRGSK